MLQLTWLDSDTPHFPNTNTALTEPNGLLAAGGQLSPEWLLHAYAKGIFPWFNEGEPILWWSPSPRTFLFIDNMHVSRSLQKAIRKSSYQITFDQAFEDVMFACAEPRGEESETWISDAMIEAYTQLHQCGHAHSIEVWEDETLVGGLYGIAIGRMFFGESMFSRRSNTSKIALFFLVQQLKEWHYVGIDCQVHNTHLASLGAQEIPRQQFEDLLKQHVTNIHCHWQNS